MSPVATASSPTPSVTTELPPWKRSWFYCAPGEAATLGWVIGLHVVGAAGLVLLPLPTLPVLAVAVALVFLGGLGTTVCYHRALAHRGLVLNGLVERALIFFAMFNGSGNPRTWVAMHRLHHATSDREDDISSPREGFWWAHLRWLWQADQKPSVRFEQDLAGPKYWIWNHSQLPILALSTFGGLLWPAQGLELLSACLWIGPIRLLWALHTQCTVNSICHLGEMTTTHGSSRNVGWLAFMHMGHGENWHANHHRYQADPRLGYGWQLDIGWWTVVGLRLCGLASKVRDPSRRRRGSEAGPAEEPTLKTPDIEAPSPPAPGTPAGG
jgi:fatty-acid desaturase